MRHSRRLLSPSLLIAICPAFTSAASAATITASSVSQTDVQAAINAASYGDTVQVPAGTATWSSQSQGCGGNTMLCIHKGINLQGGIGGATAITLSGAAPYGAICYEPDTHAISDNTAFEFSGFTIDGNNLPYGEGMLDVRNSGATVITNIKIHDNAFINNRTEVININGPVYGVAYSNTFTNCQTVIRTEGYDSKSWDLGHREYGTMNNFYFEDNTILAQSTPSAGGFTAGQGGGLVVRYNTVDLGKILFDGGQWQDLHGLQSMSTTVGFTCPSGCGYSNCTPSAVGSCDPARRTCEQWSQVKTEYYGNINKNFYNSYSTPQEWMRLRGSWMLMFNNVILGTGHMPLPDIYQYSCDSCQSNEGLMKRYSQHVQNTYVWNNIGQGEGNRPIYVLQDDCGKNSVGTPYTITENIDFWNYNTSCSGTSGCSSGIGIGTTVPTGTCTPGVAFWVWSQGTNVPATMDEMKTYTQAGKFYKCNAQGAWELYYRPYTYPHPLRGSPANAIHPTGTRTVSRNATIQVRGATFTLALPGAASIRSPELTIFDISGRTVFHAAIGAISKKAAAEGAAVYEYRWHGPHAVGTYIAIVKEAACNGASILAHAKFVVGRQQ